MCALTVATSYAVCIGLCDAHYSGFYCEYQSALTGLCFISDLVVPFIHYINNFHTLCSKEFHPYVLE